MQDISVRAYRFSPLAAAGFALLLVLAVLGLTPTGAQAQPEPVELGTADSFAVLAGQTVTNTGPTVVTGDLGLHPGTAVTGFPPGAVNGSVHIADAVALQAQSDLTTAYNDAAGRPATASVSGDLVGQTFTPGVYNASSSLGLTGTVTLDAEGDPDAAFIFQIGSTLITGSASEVDLINGAQACNVFWQVGSSATLGTNSTFVGNVLALTSISANSGATVDGRLLARNGEVTLDNNVIQRADCADDGNGDGNGDGN
ncbi:ice-binding family protein, partial [Nocardiopsis ganjiahuensis]|uniref:ice-binding family protein n=1 Tax=Nocardiopsis ganjiahuensis TaxID=239984 RepID=UPI00035C8243